MIRLPVTTGLLAALLTLGGCSLLPESEPVAVYQYSQPPQDLSQQRRQSLPLSLRVDTPQAGYAHTGPRLMVQTRDNQLLSYRGLRWPDPDPAARISGAGLPAPGWTAGGDHRRERAACRCASGQCPAPPSGGRRGAAAHPHRAAGPAAEPGTPPDLSQPGLPYRAAARPHP